MSLEVLGDYGIELNGSRIVVRGVSFIRPLKNE